MTSIDPRFDALMRGEDGIRFWQTLGIEPVFAEVGHVRLALEHRTPLGTFGRDHVMHGGAVASLIDSAEPRTRSKRCKSSRAVSMIERASSAADLSWPTNGTISASSIARSARRSASAMSTRYNTKSNAANATRSEEHV